MFHIAHNQNPQQCRHSAKNGRQRGPPAATNQTPACLPIWASRHAPLRHCRSTMSPRQHLLRETAPLRVPRSAASHNIDGTRPTTGAPIPHASQCEGRNKPAALPTNTKWMDGWCRDAWIDGEHSLAALRLWPSFGQPTNKTRRITSNTPARRPPRRRSFCRQAPAAVRLVLVFRQTVPFCRSAHQRCPPEGRTNRARACAQARAFAAVMQVQQRSLHRRGSRLRTSRGGVVRRRRHLLPWVLLRLLLLRCRRLLGRPQQLCRDSAARLRRWQRWR